MRTLVRVVGVAVVAAVIVTGGVLAVAALGQREPAPKPVAASSTPSPSPQQSAVPATGPLLPVHVYFPRTGLLPADADVTVAGMPLDRAEGRILQRLGALQHNVRPSDIPARATDPFALATGRSEVTSAGNTQTAFGIRRASTATSPPSSSISAAGASPTSSKRERWSGSSSTRSRTSRASGAHA